MADEEEVLAEEGDEEEEEEDMDLTGVDVPQLWVDQLVLPQSCIDSARAAAGENDDWREIVIEAACNMAEQCALTGIPAPRVLPDIYNLAESYQYLVDILDGGFSQWCRKHFLEFPDEERVEIVRRALAKVGAKKGLELFEKSVAISKQLTPDQRASLFADDEEDEGDEEAADAVSKILDEHTEAMRAVTAPIPDDEEGESLHALMRKYAGDVARDAKLTRAATAQEVEDQMQCLTPSWWPNNVPQADITTREGSAELLVKLRRAGARLAFGIIRLGHLDSRNSPELPEMKAPGEVFGLEKDPEVRSRPFWLLTTKGPRVAQLFFVTEDEGPGEVIAFFHPDGSLKGIAATDIDAGSDFADAPEGDEGDEQDDDEQDDEADEPAAPRKRKIQGEDEGSSKKAKA